MKKRKKRKGEKSTKESDWKETERLNQKKNMRAIEEMEVTANAAIPVFERIFQSSSVPKK